MPATLRLRCAFSTLLLVASVSQNGAADWPRFRGPTGDGIAPEQGLVDQLPHGGPKLLWKMEGCGRGYSSVAIVGDTLYTMGDRSKGDKAAQFALAFDLATRQLKWESAIGPPHNDGGPRGTPTIDGTSIYVLGTDGDLVCLDRDSGSVRWKKNMERDFGGAMMSGWRWSESPLVDRDRLICTPGVAKSAMVALHKMTGETVWTCQIPDIGSRGKEGAGYASVVAADIDGVRQYITIIGQGAIGVAAEDGRFLWGYNRIANHVANIPSPVVKGNQVFVTTSYKTGSALLELKRSGKGFDVQEVYFLTPKEFENHHGGVVLVGDCVYGGDGQNNGIPVCLQFGTGKIHWKERNWTRQEKASGSAAVVYADGHLFFRYEKDALVAMIEANPNEFRVKGLFHAEVDDGPAWAHPVVHDGKLYLRTNDVVMCYDLRAPSP